jgi:hypothetical protein
MIWSGFLVGVGDPGRIAAGRTIPNCPIRMRFVCIAKYRSRRTGLLELSNPSIWKWCSVKLTES